MSSLTAEFDFTKGYRVVSVERVNSTKDMPGTWCRYIVQRGASKIEGLHVGDVAEVTEHAENFVETLNERVTKKSYAYGSQKKK